VEVSRLCSGTPVLGSIQLDRAIVFLRGGAAVSVSVGITRVATFCYRSVGRVFPDAGTYRSTSPNSASATGAVSPPALEGEQVCDLVPPRARRF